jgi:hypothetical protein
MWWSQRVFTSPVGDREIQSPACENPYRQVDDRQQLRRVRHEHLVKQTLVALLQPHEVSVPASNIIPIALMVLWCKPPVMCRCLAWAYLHTPGCRYPRTYLINGLCGEIKSTYVLLPFQVVWLRANIDHDPLHLQLLTQHCRWQQATQVQLIPLRIAERQALVVLWMPLDVDAGDNCARACRHGDHMRQGLPDDAECLGHHAPSRAHQSIQ